MAQSPLAACVDSLGASVALLHSTISILDQGTQDFPRLTTVLQTTRHFEVTSESQLAAAQASVRAEIEPEVARLLQLVESYLERLARREEGLAKRVELLQVRQARREDNDDGGNNRDGDDDHGRRRRAISQPRRSARSRSRSNSAARLGSGSGGGGGGDANTNANANAEKLKALRREKERLAYAVERLSLEAQQRHRQLRKSIAAQGD